MWLVVAEEDSEEVAEEEVVTERELVRVLLGVVVELSEAEELAVRVPEEDTEELQLGESVGVSVQLEVAVSDKLGVGVIELLPVLDLEQVTEDV